MNNTIKDTLVELLRDAKAELKSVERERNEAKADLEFRRDLFKVQEEQLNKVREERDELRAYADKLAAGLPEGMLPKDIEVLRDANLALAVERDALQEQLDAYIMLNKMAMLEFIREQELEQLKQQQP